MNYLRLFLQRFNPFFLRRLFLNQRVSYLHLKLCYDRLLARFHSVDEQNVAMSELLHRRNRELDDMTASARHFNNELNATKFNLNMARAQLDSITVSCKPANDELFWAKHDVRRLRNTLEYIKTHK